MTHSLRVRRWAAAIFAVALAIWTWKLLEPRPVPESWLGELRSWADLLPFLMAKTLHCGGYAFLALLTMVWSPPHRRWAAVGFVMAHGVTTEILQELLPFNRTGRVADVAIDWTGVGLGVLAYQLGARVYISRQKAASGYSAGE